MRKLILKMFFSSWQIVVVLLKIYNAENKYVYIYETGFLLSIMLLLRRTLQRFVINLTMMRFMYKLKNLK